MCVRPNSGSAVVSSSHHTPLGALVKSTLSLIFFFLWRKNLLSLNVKQVVEVTGAGFAAEIRLLSSEVVIWWVLSTLWSHLFVVFCLLFWLMMWPLSYNHLSHHRLTAPKCLLVVLGPMKWALCLILPFKMQTTTTTCLILWFFRATRACPAFNQLPAESSLSRLDWLFASNLRRHQWALTSITIDSESRFSVAALPALPPLPNRSAARGHEGRHRR